VNGKRAGNLQSDKRHKPVMLLKHMVTEAPLLCRPNVNVHPSQKHLFTFENPPSARITLNEETKVREEQSTTEPYELANPRMKDCNEMDTTAPSSILVHSRDRSGMDCRAWIILFFPGLPRCMCCGSEVVWFNRCNVLVITGIFKFLLLSALCFIHAGIVDEILLKWTTTREHLVDAYDLASSADVIINHRDKLG
jgi:hypothetical protein